MLVCETTTSVCKTKWILTFLFYVPFASFLPCGNIASPMLYDECSMEFDGRQVFYSSSCESGILLMQQSEGVKNIQLIYREWNKSTFTIDSAAPYELYFLHGAPLLQHVIVKRTQKVIQLLIEHCSLASIPGTLRNLPGLRVLVIRYCRLRYLKLGDFVHSRLLKTIDLSHNQITTIFEPLPGSWGLPTTHLYLTNNSLQRVNMSVFGLMEQLNCLHLNMNHLEDIDVSVPLPALQQLSVSHNRLRTLNFTHWNFLPSLLFVYGNNNRLTSAPMGWRSLPWLMVLELSFNHIRSFRMDDLYLTQVRKLNLAGNALTTLTTSRAHLRLPLESLRLFCNRLTVLDISRWGMPNLWELNVAYNQLTELGDAFVRFPAIARELDLRHNRWSCEWLSHIYVADLQRMRHGKLATNESCPSRKHLIDGQRWVCCWGAESLQHEGILVPYR